MSPEDYELLLWMMGDRAEQVNFIFVCTIAAWLAASIVKDACLRFMKYLDYKMDYVFWHDLLIVEPN